MTGVDTEALAEGFAAQGREELIERFREAYAQALGTHADLVSFDADRVEAMVQRSAADADGLQWRRALAGVAARELGIELGPALTHPAVARAHQLVGAPSYESALAALAVPAPVPEPPAPPRPPATPPIEKLAEAELATVMPEAAEESEPEPTLAPDPAPAQEEDIAAIPLVDQPTMAYDALEPAPADDDLEAEDVEPTDDVLAHRAADFAEEFMAGAVPAVQDDFTFEQDAIELPAEALDEDITEFGAVHLGGVASLPSSEEIALRLSEEGLDLLQDDGTIVGRLGWTDIAALEVTVPHGRRRRRNAPRLVVHTAGGSARFEVPDLSGEELQDRVQPLMARFGHEGP